MKTRILYTALAAFAASSISASAQEGDRPKRDIPPEILAKFDKDGDGELNESERKAAMEARKAKMEEQRKAMIAKFDKDGDGELNESERKAAREAMVARHAKILAKYDADEDGKLSPSERKAAIDAGEELPPQRPQGRGPRDGKPGPDGKRGPGGPQGKRGPAGAGQ